MIPVQAAPLWAYAVGATFAVAAGRQLQWWERSVQGEGSVSRPRGQPVPALTVLYAAPLPAPGRDIPAVAEPFLRRWAIAGRITMIELGVPASCPLAAVRGILTGPVVPACRGH